MGRTGGVISCSSGPAGRTFVDFMDFDEQLAEWMGEIADVRLHGTTHERPIDRFAREALRLIPTAGHPSFQLEARQLRVVAADYLVLRAPSH